MGSRGFLGCICWRSTTIKLPSLAIIYYAEFWCLKKFAGGTWTNGMKKKRKNWKWGAADFWVAFLEDQKPPNYPLEPAFIMPSFGVWKNSAGGTCTNGMKQKKKKIGSEEPRIFGCIFGRSNTTKLPSGVSNYYAEFWCLNKYLPVALVLTVWERGGKKILGSCEFLGCIFGRSKTIKTPSGFSIYYAEFWYLKKSPPVALVLTVWKKETKIGSGEPRIFGRNFGRSNTTKLPSGVSNYYAEFWCLNKNLPVALVLTVWERGGKKMIGELRISGSHVWKIIDRQNTLRTQHLLYRVLVFE